jgi:hypothetical protein
MRMKKGMDVLADDDGWRNLMTLILSGRTWNPREDMRLDRNLMLSTSKMYNSGPKNRSKTPKPAKIESVGKGNQR